jgi:hypothetical protein
MCRLRVKEFGLDRVVEAFDKIDDHRLPGENDSLSTRQGQMFRPAVAFSAWEY